MPAAATHICRMCKKSLPMSRFTQSRLKRKDFSCSKCVYTKYGKTRLRTGAPYVQIARALAARERRLGAPRPVVELDHATVRQLVHKHLKCRSSVSGETLNPHQVSLVRADASRPFDAETNCALMLWTELRKRNRAAKEHADDE